jgi:acyl carrier protein phosphodiesterase
LNFLGHLSLTPNLDEILIGNFIADAVKGNSYKNFPAAVQKGIVLHRKIDEFTDSHPSFRMSRNRLKVRHGKFSGVITDIFYDHFLAVNWEKIYSEKLESFVSRVYAFMQDYKGDLPEKFYFMLPRMIQHNWLVNYRKLEGVDRTLQGMARRTSFPSLMHEAVYDLKESYSCFEKEFAVFYEDIKRTFSANQTI